MSSDKERVYVIGASGDIGSGVVRGLINKGIRTTAYVRNEVKAKNLLKEELNTGLLAIVVGTYTSTDIYRRTIREHTRLFLLVVGDNTKPTSMSEIKEKFSRIAFEEGVRQIIDISSYNVRTDGYQGIIAYMHKTSENKLFALADQNPGMRSVVILRPGAFMSNQFMGDTQLVKQANKLSSCGLPASTTTWIDTRDVADCAVVVLVEAIEKHDRCIYEMGAEVLSNQQRAEIFSAVLGKRIIYEQQTMEEFYNGCISSGMTHSFAFDLIKLALNGEGKSTTPQIALLLNRPLRTMERWLLDNINRFR